MTTVQLTEEQQAEAKDVKSQFMKAMSAIMDGGRILVVPLKEDEEKNLSAIEDEIGAMETVDLVAMIMHGGITVDSVREQPCSCGQCGATYTEMFVIFNSMGEGHEPPHKLASIMISDPKVDKHIANAEPTEAQPVVH